MNPGSYRNRAFLQQKHPKLAEALDDLQNGLNSSAQQTTASVQGETQPPPALTKVSVTAANGIFEVAIHDNQPLYRGVEYFIEYSQVSSFAQPHVIHLGTSRNWRAMLGNITLYFRAYSQYPCSAPSLAVYYGAPAAPIPVIGGGSITGPVPIASNGSGTASGDGRQGGSGYGTAPWRSKTGKPPETA